MNLNKINWLFVLLLSLIIVGCNTDRKEREKNNQDNRTFLYSENLQYAKGFSIEYYEEFTKVILNNPWSKNHEPYAEYHLYKSNTKNSATSKIGINSFNTPLTSLVVNTFSYFEFLSLLNELETINGVTDGIRIYNPKILNKLKNNEILDLGDPFKPNIEKTIELNPDAVVNSAYAQVDSYSDRVLKSGIPVIYSLEWMETTPLARAEWIKMIAAFYEKGDLADALFNEIERKYLSAKEVVSGIDNYKSVLAGDNFQDTWYLPGGESFNATLFRDAGLNYFFKDKSQRGSIGLDIESILTQFGHTDIWFGCVSDSYKQLANKDSKYMLLTPVKNKQVFNNHKRITPSGGNDYFESAIANPDLILSDIVKAAYPELMPNYNFSYIKPLK